jgi:hypothetical protein
MRLSGLPRGLQPGVVLLVVAGVAFGLVPSAPAQPVGRRAVTIPALKAFPSFYNAQQILLRAQLQQDGSRATLSAGDHTIPAFVAAGVSGSGDLEVRGELWDIGRMAPDDFRLSGRDLRALLGAETTANWPRPGEVLVVNVTSAGPAAALTAPSLRNIALAPDRYVDQRVTIQGQFRGRNLFGDQPQSPPGGDARREFVLRSAEGSIWVTGKQAKGRGFTFDINSRLDTRRWLEVSGIVKEDRGLIWIVADDLKETSPQAEKAAEPITSAVPTIPPEVLFSAPTNDETDVPLDTKVRVQFSRDLDPATLKGGIRVSYSAAQAAERGEPQAPPIDVRVSYNKGTRVMELTFEQPLERFRVVTVTLTEDVKGTDGLALKPYTVTFTLGGS